MKWDEWRGGFNNNPTMFIKRLISYKGWRLDLHKMVDKDDSGCFHTHPAKAWRFILWGGYVEQFENCDHALWKAGNFGSVLPSLCHRVSELLDGKPAYTLWLRSPKTHEIKLKGWGWSTDVKTHD